MGHSRTSIQTGFDPGYSYQQGIQSAQGSPPRAFRAQFNHIPVETRCELEHEDESLMRAWKQFQAGWKLRKERRQSNGLLPARLHDSDHASTSNLHEPRTRFSHLISSRPYQGADLANIHDAGWTRVVSLSYDRQLYQHYLSHPPPPSLSSNRKPQQSRSPQKAYKDDHESVHHPLHSLPPSPTYAAERFAQDRSDWPSASIHPRDYSNTPIYHPQAGSPPVFAAHKLRGLTRRPRVRKPYKGVPRAQRDESTRPVDPEASQVTATDHSVMSVRRLNADGSGSSFSSRFVLPPTTTHPMAIEGSEGGARRLGVSPSSHVDSETERPRSRIKAREGAGSAFANTYSIPKKEPHTLPIPSLMNRMEEEWPSLSPVSTPEAPPLDQHSVIREDLQQQDERPIAGCRVDPRISFREAAAVEDRKSLDFVHSTSHSLEVSYLQSHTVSANKDDGRKQPGQQALFQDLYQMLEFPERLGSGTLRSKMEIRRDGKSEEGNIRSDCAFEEPIRDLSRGPRPGAEQTLHGDVLLAQKVVRDAMQQDEESMEFPYQSCVLSASECGEDAVDSNSNWSECGLDRKRSTRSIFDWGYA
ncbi:hypothetical protein BDM02DRAFT_3125974 [Thelephora ganbajun]|uniref:Uncharacterized protein n=1 Tax=Thelephora ganbajun TaxID=370292 RepID=A0ACB6ZTR9_THEGA|nr:hypothetical protein BDM02DRAFT_3125974 [Thelephora ganbajun]